MTLILSVNAGSSSLKISVFTPKLENIINASFSSIGSDTDCSFSFHSKDHNVSKQTVDVSDHSSALQHFLSQLGDQANNISHVCHRVVHGGDYHAPALVTSTEFKRIETLSSLAPLHNATALDVIRIANDVLSKAKSIAVFDSSFHASIPQHISTYPIQRKVAHDNSLRKYGFHGLSYSYLLRVTSEFLAKSPEDLNLIVMHLGSGASVCAIRAGRSYDTSMGLTPVSGLPGATRTGDVDPALLFHYSSRLGSDGDEEDETPKLAKAHKQNVGIHVTEAELIVNKQAGWKAMTGTTDFGVITSRAFSPDNVDEEERKSALLAFRLFTDRILNFVASYHVKLCSSPIHTDENLQKGVEAIVFAGGIGEHSAPLRAAVAHALTESLGYAEMDDEKNENASELEGTVIDLGRAKTGKTRILMARTDEQYEMAKQCVQEKQFWES